MDRLVKGIFLRGALFQCCFVKFWLVKNSGIAFGLLSSMPWLIISINGVFIAVLSYLLFFLSKNLGYWQRIGFIMVLAGAVSNFIDRLHFGYVVDYIDIGWFPVFNLADAFITLGVLAIIFEELRRLI